MPRQIDVEDDWEGESDAAEETTIPCPYCGKEVHEDSPRCPHCERYLSAEDLPAKRKPWWIVIGTLACLYAIYRWIVS